MKTRCPTVPPSAATTALAALVALLAATALAPATRADDAGDAGDADDADAADAIVGVWETAPTDKGYAHIEMVRRGDVYDGKIVWLNELLYPQGDEMAGQTKVDRMNPDPALRQQPIIGLAIVHGLRHAGEGSWEGGTIYDPETGKTYRSKASIADGGETLNLRGYIGISLFGRTSQWKRVHEK
jgi:uncharacterized protein (DUF2147 family)